MHKISGDMHTNYNLVDCKINYTTNRHTCLLSSMVKLCSYYRYDLGIDVATQSTLDVESSENLSFRNCNSY